MTTDHPNPSKPRRRWFQYSLWSLLVAVFLLSVLFAWLGPWTQRDRRRRHVKETIHKMGGSVQFSGHGDAFVYLSHPQVTDKELKDLVELSEPKWIFIKLLGLSGSSVTNKGLVHLKGLTNLRRLNLIRTIITDAGLVHLKGLTNLRTLDLGGTQVTDAGLVHLKGLTKLQTLGLANTQVTDTGLEHLTGLTKLETLWLHSTPVTDAGLVHLKGLSKLELLDLENTQVTDEGVKKLQQALPNCWIGH